MTSSNCPSRGKYRYRGTQSEILKSAGGLLSASSDLICYREIGFAFPTIATNNWLFDAGRIYIASCCNTHQQQHHHSQQANCNEIGFIELCDELERLESVEAKYFRGVLGDESLYILITSVSDV